MCTYRVTANYFLPVVLLRTHELIQTGILTVVYSYMLLAKYKSILLVFVQHVLKDRRVLAMVQRRVAEEEGRELSSEWQEDIVTYVS